jgi:hypothetical protein
MFSPSLPPHSPLVSRIEFVVTPYAPGTVHPLKEAREASASARSPHSVGRQRKMGCPHVYTQSHQERCELGFSASK